MSTGRLVCPECESELSPELANSEEFLSCPGCSTDQRIFVFPALYRPAMAAAVQSTTESGEASCFYHVHKKAVVACDSCGRFLCALCDIEIGGGHRCPGCLEVGKRKSSLTETESRRTMWDSIALATAILPLVMWPVTILSAPATIFLVIRFWRQPLSILPRTKIRYIAAFLIATAQIVGWAILFYFLFAKMRGG